MEFLHGKLFDSTELFSKHFRKIFKCLNVLILGIKVNLEVSSAYTISPSTRLRLQIEIETEAKRYLSDLID